MAQFRYKAKNMQGKVSRGVMDVPNDRVLQQKLKADGLYLVSAAPVGASRARKKLKPRQIADFCRELSNLLGAGITLVRALEIVSEEEGLAPYARAVYLQILSDIRKGVSLSDALENQNCFPTLLKGMVRSGEGTGNLDEVMDRLADHYEKEVNLNQQVKSAMAYPLVLLCMCVVILMILVLFVLPQFEDLFSQMESIPTVTRVIMALPHILIGYWYLILLCILVLIVGIRTLLKVPRVARSAAYIKVHMPVFGKLNKVIYTARFARTLSSLYSSGMPVGGCLRMAAETIGNKYVEDQFDQVMSKVRSGVPLSEALSGVDGFQKKLASTIRVGEESGRLDTMLNSITKSMELEAQEATKRMVTLLEPIMICIMALVVGCVIVGVMLPIYQSYGVIEGA